jgi:heme exporter protein D
VSAFLNMGGYAWYVWMAYGAVAVVVIIEILALRARRRQALALVRNSGVDAPAPRARLDPARTL